jgi:hypothetical protein
LGVKHCFTGVTQNKAKDRQGKRFKRITHDYLFSSMPQEEKLNFAGDVVTHLAPSL